MKKKIEQVEKEPEEIEGVVDPEKNSLESPPSSATKEIDDNDSSSDYRVFAKALHESGVIQDFDEEKFKEAADGDGVDEALISLVSSTINKEVDSRLSLKDEQYKAIVEKLENGVPSDVVTAQMSDLKKLASITDESLEENDELAKNIIAVELRYHGYSEDRIQKRIEAFNDMGTLAEESLESLKSIKLLRNKEITKEDSEYKNKLKSDQEAKKERYNTIKNDIYSTDELIPGIKINKTIHDKILGSLTRPVSSGEGKEKNAIMHHRDKNPIAFDKMVAYLYTLGVFNIDSKGIQVPKWDKVINASKSKAVSELSNRFSKPSNSKKGGATTIRFDDTDMGDSFITSIDVDKFGILQKE